MDATTIHSDRALVTEAHAHRLRELAQQPTRSRAEEAHRFRCVASGLRAQGYARKAKRFEALARDRDHGTLGGAYGD